jgi:hypothetical protein
MSSDEYPSSFFIELNEILNDIKHSKSIKEPFFKSFFIDGNPLWRKLKYSLLIHQIEKLMQNNPSFDEILKSAASSNTKDEKHFTDIIKKIRKSLKTNPLDKYLMAGIFKIYCTINLDVFCKKIVELMKKSVTFDVSSNDLFTRLSQTRKQICNAPRSLKIPFLDEIMQFLKGQFNINYDPFIQENTPYKLFEIPLKDKFATVIRMGTQTFENPFAPFTQKAYITEEFKAFIGFVKASNNYHLYFNFQNNVPSWIGCNEAPRCRALKEFAQENSNCFYFITLPKDTSFYNQEGFLMKQEDAEKFKETFKKEYFNPYGGFDFINLDKHLDPYNLLCNIIEEVHRIFFDSKPVLKFIDRLNFIEITYLELEKHLINLLSPNTLNFTCKDGIDRAGGASALYYYDMHFKNKRDLAEHEVQELEAILFAPALLVKKRAIRSDRFNRFISAAKHLSRFTS